jgi:hypothetical protein
MMGSFSFSISQIFNNDFLGSLSPWQSEKDRIGGRRNFWLFISE